jgi:SWI/SNF-related matrix-associated actin-dependent regulator of chromatin subfamily A3
VHIKILLTDSSAHDIRNPSTKQYEAVASLTAQHRWCLTGTPIQNSLDDLGALVSFLRVPILENPASFRKFITSPAASQSKNRFQNLQTLLRTICVRRKRDLLNLPEPVSTTRRVFFRPSEQAEYDGLMRNSKRQIDMAVSGYKRSKINSAILRSLLALRLFCNNGRIDDEGKTQNSNIGLDTDETLTYLQQSEEDVCVYCHGKVYSIDDEIGGDGGIFMSRCSHVVCRYCKLTPLAEDSDCPFCARGDDLIPPGGINQVNGQAQFRERSSTDEALSPDQYPSKLLTLLADIRRDSAYKR